MADAPDAGTGEAPVPPQTEVRTFLIADVRGYTAFTQEHGDEAAARLATKFASVTREHIAEHGGRVVELRGDEALAVFSSARQALHAAVDLQAGFTVATETDPMHPLRVGIGLDAGEAVPVENGYRGGALNLAARLCSLAGPGEVLASDGVVHLARKVEGLEYGERGFAQLKGFNEPVRIIEVRRSTGRQSTASEAERGIESAEGPPTAGATLEQQRLPIGGFLGALPASLLVARESELQRILGSVEAVVEGSGQLVVLAGEPGVGKTRLAQEVTLNLRDRGFLVAAGRCYEPHRGTAFYPFLDILGSAYHQAPADIRAEAPRRWPDMGHLLPDLHISVPSPGAGFQEDQQRLLRAVTGFIKALAEEQPVSLLIDDLHWADDASLELLQHLVRHTRADRVFVLGTYRDADLGRRHPLQAALRDLTREDLMERLSLSRLGHEGTSSLIAAIMGEGSVSDEFTQLVHRHTEGNPFFIQHVLRAMVDCGDVFRQDGRWARRELGDIEVPETVRAVIEQRLSRLSDHAQEIVQLASVFGQTFEFDLLQAIADLSEGEIEETLEEAQAAGLVREVADDSFTFDHALTQQSLYAELSSRKRRRVHLAVGQALAALSERDRYQRSAEIAWHYTRGDDSARALHYTVLAADAAEAVYAYGEAEHQLGLALELARQADDESRQMELLLRRGRLALGTFRGEVASRDFETLHVLSLRSGDREVELEALLGLAESYNVRAFDDGSFATKARDLYERTCQLAEERENKPAMAQALIATERLSSFWHDYIPTIKANLRRALALSEELGDEDLIVSAKLALLQHDSRNRTEREAWRQELLTHFRSRGDLVRLNDLHYGFMWTYYNWGEFQKVIAECEAGIRVAGEIGVPPVQYWSIQALACVALGRYDEAWESLQKEVADEEHPFGRAMRDIATGIYLFDIVAFDLCIPLFEDVARRAEELNRSWMTSWAQRYLAASLIHGGDGPDPRLTGIARELGRTGTTRTCRGLAEILLAQGHIADARERTEDAIRLAQEAEQRWDHLAALELAMRIDLAAGEWTQTLTRGEEALHMAGNMQAAPMIWRIQLNRAAALRQRADHNGEARAHEEAARVAAELASSIGIEEHREIFLSNPQIANLLKVSGMHS